MRTYGILVGTGCLLAACGGGLAEPAFTPPAERPATVVAASAGRTWDAVIAHFAEQSIPIRTIDRSSGIIVTDPMRLAGDTDGARYAWCGSLYRTDGPRGPEYQPLGATMGSYNVLVRGDSARAEVRVRASWVRAGGNTACQTRDVYERELEAAIRRRLTGE